MRKRFQSFYENSLSPMKNDPTHEELKAKIAQLEDELTQKNTFIETVLENLPIGITITQYSTGKRRLINKKFEEIYGWPKEELMELGAFFRKVYPDRKLRRAIRKEILDAVDMGDPSQMQWENMPVTTQKGETKIVSGITIPLFDQDIMIGAAMDFTDNFNTLKKLKQSEERYQAIFDRSFDCIMVSDLNGHITDANAAALNVFGYSEEDIPELTLWKLVKPGQYDALDESRTNILSDGHEERLREFEVITKTGGKKIVEVRGALIFRDDAPFGILVLGRDITERKISEFQLKRTVASLHQAEQIAKLGYFEKNSQTGEIFKSDGYYKLMGLDPEEIKGTERIFDHIHEGDRERVNREIQKHSRENTLMEIKFRLVQKSGKIITLHAIGRTIFDENNRPLINTGVFRDISEERKLEEQLRQSQKMESIGTLAGGIAHDFNNILSIIIGNADLALEDMAKWHPAREFISECRNAGLRGKDIVRQLLNFSRKTEETKDTINLAHTIKESLTLLRSSISSNVEIVQNIQENCHAVNADETQIHQIMINLCSNAADAMKNQGRIDVTLENITVPEADGDQNSSSLPTNECVRLTVCDTGHGMDAQMQSRIFDPYFTTKEIGKGTGMGLAVVHGIVQAHGGAIHVESGIGKGTCFIIYFPAVDGDVIEKKHDQIQILKGTGKILFVDDEEPIVDLGKKMLAKYGYSVTGFNNPEDALSCLRSHPEAFDIVITDMAMPSMTGEQLAIKINELNPELPIILCSGYIENTDMERFKKFGIQAFLLKPVDLRALTETVGNILGTFI